MLWLQKLAPQLFSGKSQTDSQSSSCWFAPAMWFSRSWWEDTADQCLAVVQPSERSAVAFPCFSQRLSSLPESSSWLWTSWCQLWRLGPRFPLLSLWETHAAKGRQVDALHLQSSNQHGLSMSHLSVAVGKRQKTPPVMDSPLNKHGHRTSPMLLIAKDRPCKTGINWSFPLPMLPRGSPEAPPDDVPGLVQIQTRHGAIQPEFRQLLGVTGRWLKVINALEMGSKRSTLWLWLTVRHGK